MMEFRVLGPLEVADHGSSVALGGGKQRALLAVLLLHANEVVGTDRLIDELWGQAPPLTVTKSVHVYVSRLRRELGEDRVVTRPPGYLLRLEPRELDLKRFEALLAEARNGDGDATTTARTLREALALWRGPPLADLAYEPFAQIEIARLEELRWAALEARIDADLACGRHAELVGELQALIAAHPLRERLHCQLMLALYRSARQADALEAYRNARGLLSDELGLEPGEELKRLEAAILRQDPALDLATEREEAGATASPQVEDPAVLVVPAALGSLESLLELARPLAMGEPRRALIVAGVVAAGGLGAATAALAARREELLAEGLAVRVAAFSSPTPGRDIARLATKQRVNLLVLEAGPAPLDGEAAVILEHAPCDVALVVGAGGGPEPGAVLVPFGAAWHDWAALEVAAWFARALGRPLRLIGAASDERENGRDASRLLADASLIVQRTAGIVAEPTLAEPGHRGLVEGARDAGLLVVGLSDRWRQEGLGRVRGRLVEAPPAPALLVRRGPRPGGLAPPETVTRFGWSLTASAA
jgi:DNA-binding SARP family transcriptional activator